MSDVDKVFTGSIPDIYDSYLVPLIFECFAADLARRVVAATPGSILETAAGSGAVPRALAPLLANEARYVVSDLNQPMLDRAAGAIAQAHGEGAVSGQIQGHVITAVA